MNRLVRIVQALYNQSVLEQCFGKLSIQVKLLVLSSLQGQEEELMKRSVLLDYNTLQDQQEVQFQTL
jgi:hypothetical protein